MQRIVVVNSFGPMGCSLLCGLIEKLGFGNLPVRKTGLHQYLMGEQPLSSDLMKRRMRDIIIEHAKPEARGGVGVMDRKQMAHTALTDFERVRPRFDETPVFSSVADMYFHYRNIYADAVTYKPVTTNRDWHIEQTVDIHRFDPATLVQRYAENFPDVKMIHLHRSFPQWMNSLASMAMNHPELKNRIKFFPHMRYADYTLYERSVNQMPGLHITFDEMFDTPIAALAQKIANFLDVPAPAQDLTKEEFDLYGKIRPHNVAFTRFDDNIEYLRKDTISYFGAIANDSKMKNPATRVAAWLRYLGDMRRFRTAQGMKLLG